MLDLKDIWTCGNGACPKAKSGECWRYVEKPRPGISHRNVSVPYWADACRHFQPIIGLVALSASAMVR